MRTRFFMRFIIVLLCFLFFLGGGGSGFAVNCKMVSAAVVHLAVDCYKRCAYTKLFCTKLRRGRVSHPVLDVTVYDILRNLIEIVFLFCFQNLLDYGFAVFSEFACL